MILAYNTRNPLGDGCHEPSDAGLSSSGRAFVAEANRVGMLLDISHAGIRHVGFDIIERSDKPVVASHSSTPGAEEPRAERHRRADQGQFA